MNDALPRAVARVRSQPSVLRLDCGIQPYAWGDREFIPRLLGREPDGSPCAELWMGAHPELPATAIVGEDSVPLDRLIASAPEALLGAGHAELPFLFKILSAAVPLSIQAHPTAAQAEAGFAREEAAGIPIDAPHRNYKDRRHKPELLAALTEFHGLLGFRGRDEIDALFAAHPELAPLGGEELPALYERFMAAPQREVDAILDPLVRRLSAGSFTPNDPEYWLLESDRLFSRAPHRDRGLLSVLLLNLVRLAPGEAIFLPAGVLHAYLRGTGVEIMANSNNVLRGGLTPKHVDVPELLRTVRFEGGRPEIRRAVDGRYRTPAEEFELQRVLVADAPVGVAAEHPVEVLLVAEGGPVAVGGLTLHQGGVALVPAGLAYELVPSAPATLYRATLP